MIPDSASGVSVTRASPKSFCSPSVIRKTPPRRPTSSPRMITLGSASMALRSPVLRALAIVSVSAMVLTARPAGTDRGKEVGELAALLEQVGSRVHVDVVEQV